MKSITNRFASQTDSSAAVGATGDEGDGITSLALDLLKEIIDIGDAGAGAPNVWRLRTPYARGYVFGFVYALLRQGRIAGDPRRLECITVVNVELFGPTLVARSAEQWHPGHASDPVFGRGQIDGATDILHWLSDTKTLPLLLADYLHVRNVPANS